VHPSYALVQRGWGVAHRIEERGWYSPTVPRSCPDCTG
jgi:hypothetical protein